MENLTQNALNFSEYGIIRCGISMEMATLHIIKGHWVTSICLQNEVCIISLSVLKSEKVQFCEVALIVSKAKKGAVPKMLVECALQLLVHTLFIIST